MCMTQIRPTSFLQYTLMYGIRSIRYGFNLIIAHWVQYNYGIWVLTDIHYYIPTPYSMFMYAVHQVHVHVQYHWEIDGF